MADLNGKSIIITGGASGIGAAAVLLAARSGARLTVADVNESAGADIVRQARDLGATAQFVRTDISREKDVRSMVDAALDAYGRLDGAFNNAFMPGYNHRGENRPVALFADLPLDEFRKGMEVNIVGTFLCIQHEIAAMLTSGGGAIVNTSSGAGVVAMPVAPDYISAKHAIIGLTKSAALDYATRNIRVNAILPGVTRTPAMEGAFAKQPSLYDWLEIAQPIKRLGLPSEVAEAALWLLSDAASFVTGISMPVDGGFTMI
jgi:2,5-dichloro-2,5-cyclohexadiene-1,4-diol dehydrogenase 1